MSWFELDPQSIAGRVRESDREPNPLSVGRFVLRGILGFTGVSLMGFAPWGFAGVWFHRNVGELGLYLTCAIVFIGLSGPLLHGLILGSGSLSRFYKLFSIAFASYAIAWIIGWVTLRGNLGGIVGLFTGTALMGWMLTRAFDASGALLKVVATLFVLNTIGYFVGGWVEGGMMSGHFGSALEKHTRGIVAKLLWGVCYGIGFGAGLGLAFFYCQEPVRVLLAKKE